MLLAITPASFALNEARLLNMSTSGQTVVLNLGMLDGIKEGDYGVIAKQIRDLNDRNLRIVPAAKARNIKANAESSIWMLYHIYDYELLVKNDKYIVLSESVMLNGRRDKRVSRRTIVTEKNKTTSQTLHALGGDKDRLSKLKNKYIENHQNKNQVADENVDATLFDVESWESNKNIKYKTALYVSPNKEEWNKEIRLVTFEKLVTSYLRRVNDPDFNYDKFFDAQKRKDWSSSYAQFLREESSRNDEDAKLFRSVLEKGERWSEDYSDEELTNTLTKVSVFQEKDRRKYLAVKPKRFATALEYGMNLTDAQSDSDAYNRSNQYSIDADLEIVPFLKHETLERFTVTGGLRMNQSAFDAGTANADYEEYSFHLGANWYPVYAPYAQTAPVVYVGTYIRSGLVTAKAPTIAEKANYTVLTMPGFRVGMKYLFRNNFGVRVSLSFETLMLEQYEASKKNSNLPDKQNLTEGKLGIGLAYAF